jgi:hypothetical protein
MTSSQSSDTPLSPLTQVAKCSKCRAHDWTECPFAHPGEKARRRDPTKYSYSGSACPDFRKVRPQPRAVVFCPCLCTFLVHSAFAPAPACLCTLLVTSSRASAACMKWHSAYHGVVHPVTCLSACARRGSNPLVVQSSPL